MERKKNDVALDMFKRKKNDVALDMFSEICIWKKEISDFVPEEY